MLQKSYKRIYSNFSMEKRAQVTIYVILALVIIGVVIFFILSRQSISLIQSKETSPQLFLKNCISPEINKKIKTLSEQGGSFAPESFLFFNDKKVKYLCYTSSDYKTCIVQEPLLIESFEKELSDSLSKIVDNCFSDFKENFESEGYTISGGNSRVNTTIVPGKIQITFLNPMTISKGEESRNYKNLEISFESQIYDLLSIATSIIDFESKLGDSETTLYMRYYPNLKIQKINKDEGSTIYIVEDVTTKEQFIFASRSLVWPPGYGLK